MEAIQFELQNNEFVKLLLEAIGDGIFVLDARGKIIAWNPAMERITGYTADEIRGRSCNILNFSQCFGKDIGTEYTAMKQTGKKKENRENSHTSCSFPGKK